MLCRWGCSGVFQVQSTLDETAMDGKRRVDEAREGSCSRQRIEQLRAADSLCTVIAGNDAVAQDSGLGRDLRLHVLASGSRGNAAIVENAATGAGVLVDCGICKRDFFTRCAEAGFDPAQLAAVVVTHDHTDHTKGLGVVLRGLAKQGIEPVVYADAAVRTASKELGDIEGASDVRSLVFGDMLSLAGMAVHVFPTSHDAASSCGFRFESNYGDVVGFMTDTGIVTGEAHEALSGVRILALESNHDIQMLEEGPYPYPVKRRVRSDFGHLSNVQAANELEALLSSNLEHVVAMHISQNNNSYRLPAETLRGVTTRVGHGALVQVAYQTRVVSVR